MSSGYGIGAMGSYASDPAFLAAYSAYNPNFQASQGTTDAQTLALLQSQAAAQGTTETQNIPASGVSFQAAPEPSDNSGLLVGGALTTAATVGGIIYAAKRGNGEGVIAGIKNIFGGAKKALSSKATKETAKNAAKPLENIKITMKGDKPVYYIPGKTTTKTEAADITRLLADNKELKKLTGLRFKSGETTINGATFALEHGGQTNNIEFLKDKIVKITNNNGDDITKTFVENGKLKTSFSSTPETEFATKIEEYINKIRGVDTNLIFSKDLALADIHYTTKIGDNVAEVVRAGISTHVHGTPEIKKLTTLQEFGAKDDAVKAYVEKLKEEGKDISAILSEGFLKKGKLPEGYKIASFDLQDGGNIIHVVDGKAVGITIGGKKYTQNTDKFLAYKHDHEDAMNKMIQNALKNNNIPKGAIIVPQAA